MACSVSVSPLSDALQCSSIAALVRISRSTALSLRQVSRQLPLRLLAARIVRCHGCLQTVAVQRADDKFRCDTASDNSHRKEWALLVRVGWPAAGGGEKGVRPRIPTAGRLGDRLAVGCLRMDQPRELRPGSC